MTYQLALALKTDAKGPSLWSRPCAAHAGAGQSGRLRFPSASPPHCRPVWEGTGTCLQDYDAPTLKENCSLSLVYFGRVLMMCRFNLAWGGVATR